MKIFLFMALFTFTSTTKAANVLVVGDSHSVGPFGKTLDFLLREAGHSVATFASCGSIAKWWFNGQNTSCGFFSKDINGETIEELKHPTPLIPNLLNLYRPDVVIVEMGGNYSKQPSDDIIRNDIGQMVSTIIKTGAKCLWVTGPDTRNYRQDLPRLIRIINEAIGSNCKFFDSTLVTRYPDQGGDGIHYSFNAGIPMAKGWAKKVYAFFELNLNSI